MPTFKQKEKQKKTNIKFREVDVYHKVMSFGKQYVMFSESIPVSLLRISQEIHYNIAILAHEVFISANTPLSNKEKKIEHLAIAKDKVKQFYAFFQYLISTKGISPKKWDYLSSCLMDIYVDMDKWQLSLISREELGGTN